MLFYQSGILWHDGISKYFPMLCWIVPWFYGYTVMYMLIRTYCMSSACLWEKQEVFLLRSFLLVMQFADESLTGMYYHHLCRSFPWNAIMASCVVQQQIKMLNVLSSYMQEEHIRVHTSYSPAPGHTHTHAHRSDCIYAEFINNARYLTG